SIAKFSFSRATPKPRFIRNRLGPVISTDSTPGVDDPMKCGSRSRRQTSSRVARISGEPANASFMQLTYLIRGVERRVRGRSGRTDRERTTHAGCNLLRGL